MNFRLQSDDNGVVINLKDLTNEDVELLKKQNASINPSSKNANKFFQYNKDVGFVINQKYFDFAEYKGKKLSYDEYLSMFEEAKPIVEHSSDTIEKIKDSKFSYDDALTLAKDMIVEITDVIAKENDENKIREAMQKHFPVIKELTEYASSLKKDHSELDSLLNNCKKYYTKLRSKTVMDAIDVNKALSTIYNENKINDMKANIKKQLDELTSIADAALSLVQTITVDDVNYDDIDVLIKLSSFDKDAALFAKAFNELSDKFFDVFNNTSKLQNDYARKHGPYTPNKR